MGPECNVAAQHAELEVDADAGLEGEALLHAHAREVVGMDAAVPEVLVGDERLRGVQAQDRDARR